MKAIAEWRIVPFQTGFAGRSRIDEAFHHGELIPDIAMAALDADVFKAYVELELGIGIMATMAFSPQHDPHLDLLGAPPLFAGNTSAIAVRRGTYLRTYPYRFFELCSSGLAAPVVRDELV